MRFRTDDQRRAAFANMFAKRAPSKLEMFVDPDWRLRVSAENIPTTSFDLATDVDPAQVKMIIDQLDEESLAGIKKIAIAKPSVMEAYGAESGLYTGEEERVPFGRTDVPKIVVEGRKIKRMDKSQARVVQDIARGAFENIYHNVTLPDEGGASIKTDLPYDLLEERYLMQVYDDYRPSADKLERMKPIMADLDDEVWRLRSTWRLGNPDVMEMRAWRMGKKPRVGVETFVELPRGTGGRPVGSKNKPKEERSLSEIMEDIKEERSKGLTEADNQSLHEEDVVNFKSVADFLATPGNLDYVNNMDNKLLNDMIDYTTSHWGGKYGNLRNQLLKERSDRGLSEFSKVGGYEVTKVDPCILKDYAGMNWHAAKAMGFDDYPIKRKEVLIDERLGPKMEHKTVKHEIYEDRHMGGGLSYWDAHKEALKHEV